MIGRRRAADKGAQTCRRAGTLVVAALAAVLVAPRAARAQADTVAVLRDVRLADGRGWPELRIRYRTLGQARRAPGGRARNAVLLLGATDAPRVLAPDLFARGAPLDTTVTYVIVPGGADRAGVLALDDRVDLQYRLVTEVLGVDRLVLVAAAGDGCGQARQWSVRWPGMAAAVLPVACDPAPAGGPDQAAIERWRAEVADLLMRSRTDRIE